MFSTIKRGKELWRINFTFKKGLYMKERMEVEERVGVVGLEPCTEREFVALPTPPKKLNRNVLACLIANPSHLPHARAIGAPGS